MVVLGQLRRRDQRMLGWWVIASLLGVLAAPVLASAETGGAPTLTLCTAGGLVTVPAGPESPPDSGRPLGCGPWCTACLPGLPPALTAAAWLVPWPEGRRSRLAPRLAPALAHAIESPPPPVRAPPHGPASPV